MRLRQYCYRVASVVGLVCLQIFQYRDEAARETRRGTLGLAMQLTNIMRGRQGGLEHGPGVSAAG